MTNTDTRTDEKLVATLRRKANDPKRTTEQQRDDNAAANQIAARVRAARRDHPGAHAHADIEPVPRPLAPRAKPLYEYDD